MKKGIWNLLVNEPAPLDITSDITLDITFLYQILLSKFPHRHHIEKCDVDVMSDVMSKGAGSLAFSIHCVMQLGTQL